MGGKFNGEKITEIRKSFVGAKTPKKTKTTSNGISKVSQSLVDGNLYNTIGMTRVEAKELIQGEAESLKSHLESLGFYVNIIHSGSLAGPSSYLEIKDKDTGFFLTKQVRISDHSRGARTYYDVIHIAGESAFQKLTDQLLDLRKKYQQKEGYIPLSQRKEQEQNEQRLKQEARQNRIKEALFLLNRIEKGEKFNNKTMREVKWLNHEIKQGRISKEELEQHKLQDKTQVATYLNVGYHEKDQLKKEFGIKWSPDKKKWYVTGEVPEGLKNKVDSSMPTETISSQPEKSQKSNSTQGIGLGTPAKETEKAKMYNLEIEIYGQKPILKGVWIPKSKIDEKGNVDRNFWRVKVLELKEKYHNGIQSIYRPDGEGEHLLFA